MLPNRRQRLSDLSSIGFRKAEPNGDKRPASAAGAMAFAGHGTLVFRWAPAPVTALALA
jgi:hypothetical protein